MALVNHNINNLAGGVSQQPVESRFDNQVESMDNFMITVAQGLRRRNPLEVVATTTANHETNMAVHSYDRGDGLEKYSIIVDTNGLRVFDAVGAEKTVLEVANNDTAIPSTSWTGTNWKRDMRFLTVGDVTWVLNKSTTVLSTSENAVETNQFKAFYWFKKSFDNGAGAGYTYSITLNGTTVTSTGTSTITAANSMVTAINGITGFTARAEGSIIYFFHVSDFTYEYGDSWGNQAGYGWNNKTAKISDLPASMRGFTEEEIGTVAITGTDRDNFTNYYLRWAIDHWGETNRQLGGRVRLTSNTLPAKLTRMADGTFELGFTDLWASRGKGDDDSNPIPSFINSTISNMFFFKNRLGFTSGENVILSETAQYHNFFATTAMEILDSDPIDAAVDSNTVSVIRNINVTAGAVTLWADNAQFLLGGGDILSPATTRVPQTSNYNSDNSLAPVGVDNEIIFFSKKGGFLEALSYAPAVFESDKSSAESISAHIPSYMPDTIDDSAFSSASNMLFLRSDSDLKTIFVYKYYIQGGSKVISAWCKWTFADDIKAITMLDNELFMFTGTNDMLKLSLEPKLITDTFLDKGTVTYSSTVVMSSYNVETKQGTQTIRDPFYIKNIKVNTSGSVDLDIINSERNNTKTVNTKHLGRKLVIGGNSEKINIGFSSTYNVGCEIDTLSIEGRLQLKSKNV